MIPMGTVLDNHKLDGDCMIRYIKFCFIKKTQKPTPLSCIVLHFLHRKSSLVGPFWSPFILLSALEMWFEMTGLWWLGKRSWSIWKLVFEINSNVAKLLKKLNRLWKLKTATLSSLLNAKFWCQTNLMK